MLATKLGYCSVELLYPEDWPIVQAHGLTCAIAATSRESPPFMKALNNPRYNRDIVTLTKERIVQAAAANVPNVIAFVGSVFEDVDNPTTSARLSHTVGAANTVACLKELATFIEENKYPVIICVEHLNSRDDYGGNGDTGHPNYMGDDVDFCFDIIERVGSPHVKLLFDVYHVQVSNGDVCRRIRTHANLIGHIHTAGVPGRHELDATQELNYAAIFKALHDGGYSGS